MAAFVLCAGCQSKPEAPVERAAEEASGATAGVERSAKHDVGVSQRSVAEVAYALDVRLDPLKRDLQVAATIRVPPDEPLELILTGFAQLFTTPSGVSAERDERGMWRLNVNPGALEMSGAVTFRYRIDWPKDKDGIAFTLGRDAGYVLPESVWYPQEAPPFLAPPRAWTLTLAVDGPPSGLTISPDTPFHGRPWFVYGQYAAHTLPEYPLVELWTDTPPPPRLLAGLASMADEVSTIYRREFSGPTGRRALRFITVDRRGGWATSDTILIDRGAIEPFAATPSTEDRWLVAHELAHTAWFGAALAPSPELHGWLVEGAANYAAMFALDELAESSFGRPSQPFWSAWRGQALVADRALVDTQPGEAHYRDVAYERGPWAHRALAESIGEETYHQWLAELVRTQARPTIATLPAALAQVLPDAEVPTAMTLITGDDSIAAAQHTFRAGSPEAELQARASGDLLAALAQKDPAAIQALFQTPNPAVTALAGVVATFELERHGHASVVSDEGGDVVTTVWLAGTSGETRLRGPLTIRTSRSGEEILHELENIALAQRTP